MNPKLVLRTGELFVGAGGLSLGLVLANHPLISFQPLFALDNDAESLSTYEINFRWLSENNNDILRAVPHIFNNDAQQLDTSLILRATSLRIGELDLLSGGSPCQGFSSANRRAADNQKSEQNSLAKTFLDKLVEFYPKMFLIENVQGVGWTTPTDDMQLPHQQTLFDEKITAKPKSVKEYLIHRSASLGYKVWHGLVNAQDFGVPQNRVRFILFGVRCDQLPKTTTSIDLYSRLENYKSKTPTVHDAISDLPRLRNGETWDRNNYHPSQKPYVSLMRQFMLNGDLHDHFTTDHQPYVIDRFRQIPQGQNWEVIRAQMTNYADVENTHSNIYRRLVNKLPAHTISHYRKSMTIHPTQNRGLSMREACRLQSFPDWFRFQGRIDRQQQQLANAVPPLMASAIGKAIADFWLECKSRMPVCKAKWHFAKGY